ncbi:MAG: hypothetical protein KKE17_14140 [Proteobacteria bacterium]|nr:hypothetical protein [Pseudomonadota bacterium]MBU1711140.1 hypothetical protein [Pseudomonadota bacterium]
MKTCSLHDFMSELTPWLDKDHIRGVSVDEQGRFILYFMDGMKNVYQIDDCNREQIEAVLKDLKGKGVSVE